MPRAVRAKNKVCCWPECPKTDLTFHYNAKAAAHSWVCTAAPTDLQTKIDQIVAAFAAIGHTVTVFKCDWCDYRHTVRDKVVEHLQGHKPREEWPKCDWCGGQPSPYIKNLGRHKKESCPGRPQEGGSSGGN